MADHGLQVFDASGNLTLDSTQIGWVLIDTFYAGTGVSGSKSYPEYAAYEIEAIAIRLENMGGHKIEISGTTVTYTRYYNNGPFVWKQCPSQIYVFVR